MNIKICIFKGKLGNIKWMPLFQQQKYINMSMYKLNIWFSEVSCWSPKYKIDKMTVIHFAHYVYLLGYRMHQHWIS